MKWAFLPVFSLASCLFFASCSQDPSSTDTSHLGSSSSTPRPSTIAPSIRIVASDTVLFSQPQRGASPLAGAVQPQDILLVGGPLQNGFLPIVGHASPRDLDSLDPVWVHTSQLACAQGTTLCVVWSTTDGFSNGRLTPSSEADVVRTFPSGGVVRVSRKSGDWLRVIGFGRTRPLPAWVEGPGRPFVNVRGGKWPREWSVFVADAIAAVGTPLLTTAGVPRDMGLLCPGYHSAAMTQEERVRVWVLAMASIVRFESDFNPRASYLEGPPLNTYSLGLLQLSYGDETRHSGCPLNKSADNIYDPKVNLTCGIAIMRNQLRERRTFFTDNYYYWSVLTNLKTEITDFFKSHSSDPFYPAACRG